MGDPLAIISFAARPGGVADIVHAQEFSETYAVLNMISMHGERAGAKSLVHTYIQYSVPWIAYPAEENIRDMTG